ncbi:hypothetical protein SYK_07070 [Pseudodesulfovibrio nedwellii]|uniref:Uncharacterized protein n=1 Tax=Pseudodesulfovibrio nedwellii TaxID=2973072 RepID=A0ABM8AYC9_9BACT|nr:hypothetical protein [Pseudodesulfovibrio nedwellii]BDQ36347.1 hypothetical protein SYK_07070 [Pseudodesulfovibrio nedwellii]
MSVYLVTYDLSAPGRDYNEVLKRIRSYDGYAEITESTHAVSTNSTAEEVRDYVSGGMDKNDTLYIIALHLPWAGIGPKRVNEWLNNHLTGC